MTTANPSPRRFLIASAVAHYQRSPQHNRPELSRARRQIIDLFTGQLGYEHVSDLGLDPDRNTLLEQLNLFATDEDRRPDDIVVVYLTGHGELVGTGDRHHVFCTADADVTKPRLALPTSQIVDVLCGGTILRQVLLLLDTCYSGQGGRDAMVAALGDLDRAVDPHDSGVVVVASAQPAQQAVAQMFPRLLTVAVESVAAAVDTALPTLELGAVVQHMNGNPERPEIQSVEWNAGKLTGRLPAFLVNPRHHAQPRTVERAIAAVDAWDQEARQRTHELTTHMVPTAMASVNAAGEWWFAGRHKALADIQEWLSEPDGKSPLLVVTASPGSGKTALLGLVAMLTDPERHDAVPTHSLGLPASVIPAVGSVDVTIYGQGRSNAEVMRGLAAAAHVQADTPDDFRNALTGRQQPFTVLIDAVDEAETPDTLLTRLIVPLADHNEGRLRLLLGTRPHLLRHLHSSSRIDLDDPVYADQEALTGYAHRVLLESTVDSPYRAAPHPVTADVARAVAAAAAPSFLVARITALTLAMADGVPDRRDRAWRDSLPRTASTAMAQDLDRLGDAATRARDLLRPLAYAEGQGLPWEDVWAALASALAGRRYTDDDLIWLRRATGSYVIDGDGPEGTVHKLYHRALAEHLREGVDERVVHAIVVDVLTRRVPRGPDGRRDWARAHPYTLRHLGTHAARAAALDDLLTDADYLVHAQPDALVGNLRMVRGERGRRVADIYRTTVDLHKTADPTARRQLLAVDAARHGDAELAESLAAPFRRRPTWATGSQTSGALHATLSGHSNSINALAGARLDGVPVVVTAGDDRTVRVWDLAAGQEIACLVGHERSVRAVACTVVDGVPLAVTAGDDLPIRVWNLLTNAEYLTLVGHQAPARVVVCTTVGELPVALTAGEDRTVRVWNLRTGREHATLTGHAGTVNALCCTALADTPVAVTGSDDRTVRVWDLARAVEHATLFGHTGAVKALHCTRLDGAPAAITGSDDRTVRVWNLATATEHGRLVGQAGWVNAVACHEHDGRAMIVVASDNPVVQVWDPADRRLLMSLQGHTDWVNAVVCGTVDDVPLAITAGNDRTVRVWNLRSGQQTARFTGHTDWITALARHDLPGGPVAVSAGHDGTARVWDLAAGRNRATLVGHTGGVNALASAVIAGVPVAASASDDRTVRIWNLATGAEHGRLAGHTGWVNAVTCDVMAGAPVAITASDDRTVRIWNLATGTEHGRLLGHTGWVKTVACHRIDGVPVAITGSDDRTVRVWDLASGVERDRLTGHTDWVGAIACAELAGAPVAVTGSHDGAVLLWDLRSPHVRRVLTGHSGPVNSVACLSAGERLIAVTVSNDATVRVWELADGVALGTLFGHDGWVNSVACAVHDGVPIAVTGGDDRTVRVWHLADLRETDRWTMPYEVQAVTFGAAGEIIAGTGHEVVALRISR